MKNFILLTVLVCFLTSCNVTESIVFNNDMGGKYVSSFDMSPLMDYANSMGSTSEEAKKKEKIDTTIVFSDLFVTHADSIAALSDEQRVRLEKLKGMVVDVHMDEENSVFNFNMTKVFKSFDDLKDINKQLDDAMGVAKNIGNKDGKAPTDQMDELTKSEEVIYSFKKNTFTRFQPSSAVVDEVADEISEEDEENEFSKQFEAQFEEVFASSYYILVYEFPRKVKSVSNENAVVSEDGKTVTYKVPWSAIQKDKSAMNLNVILED